MDLKEIADPQSKRHPWEKVRAKFIQRIVKEFAPESFRILDIGCGDGYIAQQLLKDLSPSEYIGIDTHLTPEQIDAYNKKQPEVTFSNDGKYASGKQFDLVLLLDVIEHIEDDENFIMQIVSENLVNNSKMLITVPAFPFLYGSHDTLLGHHRRYTQNKLKGIVKKSNCKTLASGYMFASLLVVRSISIILQKISLLKEPDYSGVGQWNGPSLLSNIIEHALTVDNQILFSASKSGFIIPGLSLWTFCEKQQ